MKEALVEGFINVWMWPALLYMFVGMVIGLFIGVVPGLLKINLSLVLSSLLFRYFPKIGIGMILMII